MGVAISPEDQRLAAVKTFSKAEAELVHARKRLKDALEERAKVLHRHESEIGTAKQAIADAEHSYRAARAQLFELVPEIGDEDAGG